MGESIANHLTHARRDVPVNYIWVHEEVLWGCDHLQSLERSEDFPDFYLTVFCQIPLILVDYTICRGVLRKYIDRLLGAAPQILDSTLFFHGAKLRHECNSPGCRPKKPWEERRREIKARKYMCPRETQLTPGQA